MNFDEQLVVAAYVKMYNTDTITNHQYLLIKRCIIKQKCKCNVAFHSNLILHLIIYIAKCKKKVCCNPGIKHTQLLHDLMADKYLCMQNFLTKKKKQ